MSSGASLLRVAGRGRLGEGTLVTWSVAEGTRGRRWRAVTSVDGRVDVVLLLEQGSDLRLSRLELTSGAGMLTLHPEPDRREIHGNVVHAGGVRPLAFAWSAEHEVDVVPAPIASVAMLHRLSAQIKVGEGETIPVLSIDGAFTARPATRLVRRLAEDSWEVADLAAGRSSVIDLDARGVPRLRAGMEWPLEP